MEIKTIIRLCVVAVVVVLVVLFAGGIIGGKPMEYKLPATYTAERANDFSTVQVAATVRDDKLTEVAITSSGANDIMNDATREEWAASIVEHQTADNDVISGATLAYSAASVKEATNDILVQAGLLDASAIETAAPEPEPEPMAEAEPEGEAEALNDGVYSVDKTTDFSQIHVEMSVDGGKVVDASIESSGASDLLTDDHRGAWASQIVEKQAVDAVSGVTISSNAVGEAVAELMAQARGEVEAIDESAAKVAELEAALAEAEARAAEAEAKVAEAEQKAADAEAKVAELEAASVQSEPEPEAEPGNLTDGGYAVEKVTDFSDIWMFISVQNGNVSSAQIWSHGDNDLLTDEQREAWAKQIVENQDVDAVSGVTVSSNAVKEGLAELLERASGKVEEETEAESKEPGNLIDGGYAIEKVTDFSDIWMFISVQNGNVSSAQIWSHGDNDLLTDEQREAWAKQIVEKQDVDTVSGVTVSSNAVKEGLTELLERASGKVEEEAEAESKEPGNLIDGGYAVEMVTDFSDIWMFISVENGNVASAQIWSHGDNDLLTDEQREAWAKQIVEQQDVDAVSGVTISSNAVKEGLAELLERAGGKEEAEPAESEAKPVAEAKPGEKAEEKPEAESGDAGRMAKILAPIVVSMGDNKENSYVVDYLEQDPYLVNIYEGYGFAKDYGSARGHTYTLEDVAKTQRPHPKANCLTCKTPDMHKMIEEQGVAVYSMPFDEVMAQMTQPIGCYTCHGSDTGNDGAIVVTHQYVNEALGDNVSTINAATLSCGQCHIEYYFTPEDSEAMMPYHSVGEMTPEAILAYYDSMDFADWTQESTGTRLLKAQHPEMETVLQGKHAALLSCADCHMPTETTEDGYEYMSHLLVSPLESEALLNTCAKCHGDTDMTAKVKDIQAQVTARETEVGNKLSSMKDALAEAVASGKWSEDDLNAVRKLHREAQWFFDYCYVENSEGAHNSELANRCLDTAEQKIDEALALLEKT